MNIFEKENLGIEPLYHITTQYGLVGCENLEECVFPAAHHVCKLHPGESLQMVLLEAKKDDPFGFGKDPSVCLPHIDVKHDDPFIVMFKLKSFVKNFEKMTGDKPARYNGLVWVLPAYYSLRGLDLQVKRTVDKVNVVDKKLVIKPRYIVCSNNEVIYSFDNIESKAIDYNVLKQSINSAIYDGLVDVYSKAFKSDYGKFMVEDEISFIAQNILYTIITVENLFGQNLFYSSFIDRIVGIEEDVLHCPVLDDMSYTTFVAMCFKKKENKKGISVSNRILDTTYILPPICEIENTRFDLYYDTKKLVLDTYENNDKESKVYVNKRKMFGSGIVIKNSPPKNIAGFYENIVWLLNEQKDS